MLTSKFEKPKQRNFIYASCAAIILIALSTFNLSFYYSRQIRLIKKTAVLGTQSNIARKLDYWYGIVSKHPDYFVAWLEISKLENRRGNIEASLNAIRIAEKINPNSEELFEIKTSLSF